MVEAAGLLMNEKDVIEGKKDYLNFARYFAKSLICKNAISFSLSDDKQSLQLHLSYDFGSYKAPGTLLVRKLSQTKSCTFSTRTNLTTQSLQLSYKFQKLLTVRSSPRSVEHHCRGYDARSCRGRYDGNRSHSGSTTLITINIGHEPEDDRRTLTA